MGRTEVDAYGREVYASGAERGGYRFAGAKGYVNDDATGMRMLGARYYLPQLGRFLTPDPIGQEGGLNLYGYCDDSPLQKVDPEGTQTIDSVTSNTQAQVARGLTNPEGAQQALGTLREMMQEVPSQAGRNIVRNGIRQLLGRENVIYQQGFRHSFKHAAQYFGRRVTLQEATQWENIVNAALRSKYIFATQTGGASAIGYIARVQGVPFVVKFFTNGDRAGEIATAFRVSNSTANTMFRAARDFASGH